jgi:hypothetical protein
VQPEIGEFSMSQRARAELPVEDPPGFCGDMGRELVEGLVGLHADVGPLYSFWHPVM